MVAEDPWQGQLEALGAFIRAQRRLADLSLRELATITKVSNAYLSQIERGLHQPSFRVLRSIADALGISADQLLSQAGLLSQPAAEPADERLSADVSTEAAIRADRALTEEQRQALLSVYRSFLRSER